MQGRAGSVLLIGLRGSGKSTVGPVVARALGLPFADLDPLTATQLNCSNASDAFRSHGENAFRAAEIRALRELLNATPAIIGLGGGTPTAPGFLDLIGPAPRDSVIVYLRAKASTLRERLAATDVTTRPSLTGKGTLTEIEDVLHARHGLYQSLCDLAIDVDDQTTTQTAAAITAWLASHPRTS